MKLSLEQLTKEIHKYVDEFDALNKKRGIRVQRLDASLGLKGRHKEEVVLEIFGLLSEEAYDIEVVVCTSGRYPSELYSMSSTCIQRKLDESATEIYSDWKLKEKEWDEDG